MSQSNIHYHQHDTAQLFSTLSHLQYGELHIKQDLKHHFFAAIAVHSTARGPALGGCRFIPYQRPENAITDVLRLAHTMSYKAAISNLALGGGKAVIIHHPEMKHRQTTFELFGEFVDYLGGRYITAEDSGTSVTDMDIIRTKTPHVTGHSQIGFAEKDPSPLTALGVVRGMEAAVFHKLSRNSLDGVRIVIQGVGNVGYRVAALCTERGAEVTICDINTTALENASATLNVSTCYPEEIYAIPCDIFSPCALSNAVSIDSLRQINALIVAGAANNQLATDDLAEALHERGILYAPDYVINAGGLIHVAAQYYQDNEQEAQSKVLRIYDTLLNIFQQSTHRNCSTLTVANEIAQARLNL